MNQLYYGDNLTVLRGSIDDESVDLVYLDPPFNSQATYNVLFKSTSGERSKAQIEAFGDTWHWGEEAELAFDGVINSGNSDAGEMLRARTKCRSGPKTLAKSTPGVAMLRGLHITMEQVHVDEGLWMPEHIEVRAAAKILLVKSLVIDRVLTFSEYSPSQTAAPSTADRPVS